MTEIQKLSKPNIHELAFEAIENLIGLALSSSGRLFEIYEDRDMWQQEHAYFRIIVNESDYLDYDSLHSDILDCIQESFGNEFVMYRAGKKRPSSGYFIEWNGRDEIEFSIGHIDLN